MSKDDKELVTGGCIVSVLLALCFPGCYGCSKIKVADGHRDSTIRRVTETGVVYKTWEVESLGDGFRLNEGKASPETFDYTVRDGQVLDKVKKFNNGAKVRIHYDKYLAAWRPNGDSNYVITDIEEVK